MTVSSDALRDYIKSAIKARNRRQRLTALRVREHMFADWGKPGWVRCDALLAEYAVAEYAAQLEYNQAVRDWNRSRR